MTSAIIPRATYRLQFHAGFDFDAAIAILPYLARLGISHVYCSPILRARPGSLHGYDVIAHDEINPEIGGRAGFDRFAAALRQHGMGQLLDLVPNHMGVIGADNRWWADVLEHGAASVHARHFDIQWRPTNADLNGKVMLPILGEHYGEALKNGLLVLGFDAKTGGFALHYHEHRFPLDPRTAPSVLERAAESMPADAARNELESLIDDFRSLAPRPEVAGEPDPAPAAAADRLKHRLATLVVESHSTAASIDAALAEFNAPEKHDLLHALHEAQAYRLTYWHVAVDEINYRRFFDVNELAALRMEDPAVFEATHALALDLAAGAQVDGLRIDHPDGLYDPATYFERLQQGFVKRLQAPPEDADRPLYVVAEKIAASHEVVPENWQIHGTTGYRFAMLAGGVLVDTNAGAEIDRIWREFSGEQRPFAELAYLGKRKAARHLLASELTTQANALLHIARADRRTRDYSFNALRDALAEVAACMPVYRTYVMDQPSAQDVRFIDWAIAHARQRSEASDASIFDFVKRCMLNAPLPDQDAELAECTRQFAIRFQQFCSPVAAKGVEDTAFYRFHRLVSLNEVGGDPGAFGITPRAFHGASADRAKRWPHTILATSTHDNKRSEDVRSRINVLSEMPAEWEAWLQRWSQLAAGWRTEEDGAMVPSRIDEYLLFQTLLGTLPAEGLDADTLPAYRERIQAYMLKAIREAKAATSWARPNLAYEKALAGYIDSLLARVQPNPLLTDITQHAGELAWYGGLNSLTTVLLKFTAPGVPDLYQGNELMDLSLVDPDNRRPVDFAKRIAALDELATWNFELSGSTSAAASGSGAVAERLTALQRLASTLADGRLKLWITWRLLQWRATEPALIRDGSYAALGVSGASAEHVLAYSRTCGGRSLHVVSARLFAKLAAATGVPVGTLPVGPRAWADTMLMLPGVSDGTRLRNVLTGSPSASPTADFGSPTRSRRFRPLHWW